MNDNVITQEDLRGGWRFVVTEGPDGKDIKIFNPKGPNGEPGWFVVSTVGNPYGAPMINQEPDLGVPCSDVERIRGGVKDGDTIVGALIMSNNGEIVARFSWSNLVFMQKGGFEITAEGELLINGESKGWLKAIFLADKNRMTGYVGIFVPEKTEVDVVVLEMEDLIRMAMQ